jgi:hypothetical protein
MDTHAIRERLPERGSQIIRAETNEPHEALDFTTLSVLHL